MAKGKPTPRQAAAIKWRLEIGERIAKEYPEIAASYREGWYQSDIAVEYGFEEKYNLNSEKTAEDAVGYALKLLIPAEEMRRISAEHQRKAQRDCGIKAKKEGTGVHALSLEDRRKYAREGSEKIMREKLGIFKPGYERKPSENNIRSHGQIPWTDAQRAYFAELKSQGLAYREIAVKLEEKFGVRRKPEYLGPYFYRMIKNRKRA